MFRATARSARSLIRPLPLLPLVHRKPILPMRALSTGTQPVELQSYIQGIRDNSAFNQSEPFRTLAANFARLGLSSDNKLKKIILENKANEAAQINQFFKSFSLNTVFLDKLCEQDYSTLSSLFKSLEKVKAFFPYNDKILFAFQNHFIKALTFKNPFIKASDNYYALASLNRLIDDIHYVSSCKYSEERVKKIISAITEENLLDKLLACKRIDKVLELSIVAGGNYKTIIDNESHARSVLDFLKYDYWRRLKKLSSLGREYEKEIDTALLEIFMKNMSEASNLYTLIEMYSLPRSYYSQLAENISIPGYKAMAIELNNHFAGLVTHYQDKCLLQDVVTNPQKLAIVLELIKMSDHSVEMRMEALHLTRQYLMEASPELLNKVMTVCREITRDSQIVLTPLLFKDIQEKLIKQHYEARNAAEKLKAAEREQRVAKNIKEGKIALISVLAVTAGAATTLGIFSDRKKKTEKLEATSELNAQLKKTP
ncbi:MAG: hypothetical protein ACYCQI_16050 [Gammaproteobacteria bacterium]